MARGTRRRPSAVLATSLLAASCGQPSPLKARSEAVQPTDVDLAQQATRALAGDAVFQDRYARATLYTWTTAAQIDELRAGKPLLSREESPIHGAAYSDQVLEALAQRGDAIAKLLYTSGFARARHAWATAWATRAGWPDEQYGDQLIRIALKPDAIIVALSTATGTFEARSLDDRLVSLAELPGKIDRVAAIYFTSDATRPGARGLPKPTATFREYLVCNESMIAAWSVADPEILRELEREASGLDAVVAYLRAHSGPTRVVVPGSWTHAVTIDTPEAAFAAALAFDNVNYRLDPDQLALIAQMLRSTPKPPVLAGTPTAKFPGTGVTRKPSRVVPAGGSTFASTYAKPSTP
jgi:hypothetical protein